MTATRVPFTDAQYPAHPYPGARPDFSFVHVDGVGHPLDVDGGWCVGATALDDWLARRGAPPAAARHPLLAYGSNACPAKITWLRENLGLTGPVVVVRARTDGLAAVWAAGRRVVDDQRPATLTAVPGAVEVHGVWLATDEQLTVLDVCEGRGVRYELARVRTGRVTLDDGTVPAAPLAYVGVSPARMPLLVDGVVVRCVDVPQAVAATLDGVPAAGHGLDHTALPPGPVG